MEKAIKILIILFLLSGCKNSNIKKYLVYHLIPVGYEGPIMKIQSSEGTTLEVVGDTLFVKYDKKGMAFHKRMGERYKVISEKYFYVNEFGEIKNECPILDNTERIGSCKKGPYSSVIVTDELEMIEFYKDKRFELIQQMNCNASKVLKVE